MTKILTLVLFACVGLTHAQVFNRAIVKQGNESAFAVSNFNSAIYLSYLSGRDPGHFYTIVEKLAINGSTLIRDTIDGQKMLGWPSSIGVYYVNGHYHLPDSTFLVYGNFRDGCDFVREYGSFVIHFDKDLNRLHEAAYKDSLDGGYELVVLDTGYALIGVNSIIGLNSSFIKTSYWSGGAGNNRGTVYTSNGDFLKITKGYATTAVDSAFYYNIYSGQTRTANSMGGIIHDFTPSKLVQVNPGNKLVIYDKLSLQKVDSVSLNSLVNFQPSYIDFISDAILIADAQHYAVVSKSSLTLIETGLLHSNGDYQTFRGKMFYRDSTIIAATSMRTGQINVESFKVGQPMAPVFNKLEVKVDLENYAMKSISNPAPTVRNISIEADWQVTLFNRSSEVINSLGITYNYYQSWNCGGDNHLIIKDGISIQPGDSIVVSLKNIGHNRTITGSDFPLYLNVAGVAVNQNIVATNKWVVKSHTIKNIGLYELRFVDFKIDLFPNPANNTLNLQSEQNFKGTIAIYDVSGQKVFSKAVQVQNGHTQILNISMLPSGVYFLEAQGGNGTVTQRFLKK